MKLSVEKEKAIYITATFKDFDGDAERWKWCFYELWRYQLTFGFAHKISLNESAKDGVFVYMIIRPAYKDNIIETMHDLGYKKVESWDTSIGVLYEEDTDECADIHCYLSELEM